MTRESSRIASALAAAVAVALIYTVLGYLFVLNRRMSRELMGYQWRTPTEIWSAPRGQLIARVYGADWRVTTPVRIGQLPGYIPNAFVAAEDVRFRRHPGVDPIGVARALLTNLRRRSIAQGGSTIDQQLIKSKFLTSRRTYSRKVVEMMLAVMLNFRMSKDDILEAYLNDVYLGHVAGRPVLGLDEAARLYFDRKPQNLSVGEAALLAGIIRAPNRDTPDRRPELAHARRDAILGVMRQQGWISDAQYREGIAERVEFSHGTLPDSPYRWYLAALRTEVLEHLGENAFHGGALRITCEIDPGMQRSAEHAVHDGVTSLSRRFSWLRARSGTEPLQAALIAVDPVTGGVRAIVGGSDYGWSKVDRTLVMRRQPGSAFKTFAYLAAIRSKRFTNSSLLLDAPVTIQMANDRWEPHNYDERYRGRVSFREAFEMSLNVPTVRMTRAVGLSEVIRTAKKVGFSEDFQPIPALPLGVTEVTVRELTRAYTIFPTLGMLAPEPHLLVEVRTAPGKVLYRHEGEAKRVVDAAPAYVVHSLLRGVVRHGTASRLRRYGLGYVAGKTGTTSDYRDAWFVGYTPDLVATVWVGYDRGYPIRLSSSEAALPIWGDFMAEVPPTRRDIARPDGVVIREIDPESGFLWAEGCPGPMDEVYLSGTAPTRQCPRGFFGNILRRILFDRDSFDEPPAITFEQFREWSAEMDRQRQQIEGVLERVERWLGK